MRWRKIAAVTVVLAGASFMAACGQQPAEEPAAAPEAPPPQTYDLSPESNAKFLADNRAKEGVMVRPSGLQYRVVEAGDGEALNTPEDLVSVSYSGRLIDGTVFDETDPGETVEFAADGLIAGWVEALSLMKEGDRWELVIPSELGYGAFGAGGVIPPNQTLVFEMHLVEVTPAAAPGAP
jgi:FKBP-type peptidyl-prolyl cis-trans isomerase